MAKFKQCPRCQKETAAFIKIETGMKLGLEAAEMANGLPSEVCPPCYQDLAQHVSEGARLRAEQKAKEANRANMWANRVALIKQGRELMMQKAFAEAAISYEKYLRIIEIVHEIETGEISPTLFKNSSKAKELTVITSVYWDLLRIYDSSPQHVDRQIVAARKLAEFARHTPIFGDIAKKTIEFKKKAKNKEPFEIFMRTANIQSARCFIASATFQSNSCIEVRQLCAFRDQILAHNIAGKIFIRLYYKISPRIADFLDNTPRLRKCLRPVIRIAAKTLFRTFRLKKKDFL